VKQLILLRGLPGSGKSTFANLLGGIHVEADQYFIQDGEYKFDASKLKQAHNWCKLRVEHSRKQYEYEEELMKERAIEFAKWLAKDWMSIWVVDKWMWEWQNERTSETFKKYKEYYTEEELYEIYLKEIDGK